MNIKLNQYSLSLAHYILDLSLNSKKRGPHGILFLVFRNENISILIINYIQLEQ